MKRLARSIAAFFLVLTLGFGTVGTASAVTCSTASNPLSCACGAGGGVGASDTCKANGSNPFTGPNGVLKKISLVLAFLAGVTAVVIILVGGFLFVTANGDAQKVANARRAVLGAVIGLVIVAASETIVLFVVSKL